LVFIKKLEYESMKNEIYRLITCTGS
jgi:hypothetical protein